MAHLRGTVVQQVGAETPTGHPSGYPRGDRRRDPTHQRGGEQARRRRPHRGRRGDRQEHSSRQEEAAPHLDLAAVVRGPDLLHQPPADDGNLARPDPGADVEGARPLLGAEAARIDEPDGQALQPLLHVAGWRLDVGGEAPGERVAPLASAVAEVPRLAPVGLRDGTAIGTGHLGGGRAAPACPAGRTPAPAPICRRAGRAHHGCLARSSDGRSKKPSSGCDDHHLARFDAAAR